jgi:phosphoesterase RecJ-like protein
MPFDPSLLQEVGQEISAAQRVMVVSHVRPDGDAIGSLLGLGLALQETGKDVQMILEDGLPSSYRHLEGSQQIRKSPQGEFDFIIMVDCSDLERVGEALAGYRAPDLNIDHHLTNLNFARFNLVDTQAVATAEIIADLLPVWDIPLSIPSAAALLTGLITDTIGFRTSNMTPKALRLAADLMAMGIDLPNLYQRALVNRSYEAMRLWGAGLSKLERNGRMVWTTLTLADRADVHYPGRDDADLINMLVNVEGADVAVIFLEQSDRRVKVSWRAQPGIDVSRLALNHGGGGHSAASGAEIPGSLEEVRATVLSETRELLGENDFVS